MFVGLETFQSFPRPFNMSQLFPKSILLHFPSEIYLRRGVGELFPLLVRALQEKEMVAMQFLREGRVRVTVRSEAFREDLLLSEFRFENTVVPVTPADCVAKSVICPLKCPTSLLCLCFPLMVKCTLSSLCITKSFLRSALVPVLF